MAIGVGTALALCAALPLDKSFPTLCGLSVVICSIGALAPDLDIDQNELEETGRESGRDLSRLMRRSARGSNDATRIAAVGIGIVFLVIGEFISRVVEALAWLIQRVTTHRGMTHSLLALAFTTALAMVLSQKFGSHSVWWGLCWGAGYTSHLISDSWTWSGVRFLQPFSERHFWLAPRFLRFRVGTWRDTLLRWIAPFAGLAVFIWQSRVLDIIRK